MWRAYVAVATILVVPAVPASAQACIDNAGEIVDGLYRQILEREPDTTSSGICSSWPAAASRCARPPPSSRSRPSIVPDCGSRSSNRHSARSGTRRPSASTCRPSPAASPTDGQTLDDVAIAFAAEEVQSQNPETAVIAMYRRLLGRDPSDADVAHFRERLQREGPQAVATTLVTSPEYRERFGRNAVPSQGTSPYAQAVRTLYRHLLGRDADPEGLAQFTRLASESGFDRTIDQIMASAEYREKYGEQGVPGSSMRYCGAPVGTTGR